MKKILLSLVLGATVLSGCGGSGGDTTTCTQEVNGQEMEVIITPDGDKLSKLEMTMTQKGVLAEISDADKETGLEALESMYTGVEGIEVNAESDGDDVKLILTIDAQNADSSVLATLGLSFASGDLKDVKVKDLIKNAEDSGAECK